MTTQPNGENGANGGKWHARYPDLGTGPISIEPYISREYFEQEREHIFRKVWLNVGLRSKEGSHVRR